MASGDDLKMLMSCHMFADVLSEELEFTSPSRDTREWQGNCFVSWRLFKFRFLER